MSDLPTPAEWQVHKAMHRLTVSQRDAAWLESTQRLARIEQLEAWKAEGLAVLDGWEKVWEAAGRPGPLGHSKSSGVLARIDELEAALRDTVEWLDRTDRDGCAHTEHARRALGDNDE